jgi:hypothetical protein
MRVQAATALLLAVVGLLRGSQLVAAAPPADAFELTVFTGAACGTPVGDTIEGALARCLPLTSPAAAALGLVAIAVECSPDGTEGVVIPFADAGCENITAPPPVLMSAACTAVPPELLGAAGPTAVTGLVLTCGIPTPPTPPPNPPAPPSPLAGVAGGAACAAACAAVLTAAALTADAVCASRPPSADRLPHSAAASCATSSSCDGAAPGGGSCCCAFAARRHKW